MATTNSNTLAIAPELLVKDGQVFCTSLQIAHHFDKEHFNVLRDIEEQIEKVKTGRHAGKEASMFQNDTYPVINNLGHKVNKPMYRLNRSGFVKLVNGYNGQKASDIQMDYIEAFDQMEAVLKAGNLQPQPLPSKITRPQLAELDRHISMMAKATHMKGSTKWKLDNHLRYIFNVENTSSIHPSNYPAAKALIESMHKHFFDHFVPVMDELTALYFDKYLCGDIPNTADLKKKYHAQMQATLPKPINWASIAQQIGYTGKAAVH